MSLLQHRIAYHKRQLKMLESLQARLNGKKPERQKHVYAGFVLFI